MEWILLTIVSLLGILIYYQDITSRSVVWFLFPLLITAGFFYSNTHLKSIFVLAIYLGINVSFLALLILLLRLYYLFKEGKRKFIDKKLGLGDILFLLCSAIFFSPMNFML